MAADRSGNAMVAGDRLLGPGRSGLFVASFNGAGRERWTVTEPGQPWSGAQARAAVVEPGGDVLVVGVLGVTQSAEMVVARYDGTTGAREWLRAVETVTPEGPTDGGAGNSLVLDGNGGVLAGGYVTVGGSPRAAVAKLDAATGEMRWTWTGAVGEARSVAVGRRAVFAVGTSFAVCLNPATGASSWTATLPRGTASSASGAGRPYLRSVVVDRSGTVVVSGALRNSEEDTRAFYVAGLEPTDGRVRWQQSGPSVWGAEMAVKAVADSGGSVYLGGRMRQSPTVMRLRPNGGSSVWSRRPWTPDGAPDMATGVLDIAADDGCVYAAGADGADRFLVTALNTSGSPKWRSDLGPGRAVAIAPAIGDRLFAVGRQMVNGTSSTVLVAYGKTKVSASRR